MSLTTLGQETFHIPNKVPEVTKHMNCFQEFLHANSEFCVLLGQFIACVDVNVDFFQRNPHHYRYKNSIRDACTPQPGEIFFNTMRYISSVTVQSSRYFQSSVSYIKVQIMLK